MQHYKLNKSRDGVERLTCSVDFRLTLEDIATLVTADRGEDFRCKDNYTIKYGAIKSSLVSRKGVMEIAKAVLYTDGIEVPVYRVSDNNLEKVYEAVLERINELWRE